jgi:protein-tyrosine phosphatase
MPSDLYWIHIAGPPRLAIMARPRAGDWLEDEIAHWKSSGVERIVSLLERDEIDDLGLGSEAAQCAASGIEYLSFPIPDRGVPDVDAAMRFAAMIVSTGKSTAIHCRAGIGRSSLMAAAVLISGGAEAAIALSAIEKARGLPIPDTDAQRAWVVGLGGKQAARL